MSLAAESFLQNVEQFCRWAEGEEHELVEGRQWLLALMTSIPLLEGCRAGDHPEENTPRRSHEQWVEDHRRFADLPFQYYGTVLDSHDADQMVKPGMGDLCDDFADIYGHLWQGLHLHRAGRTEQALASLVRSYFEHWGDHASSALKAVDDFYRRDQQGIDRV